MEIRRKARWGVLAGVLAAGGMSMSVWAGVAGMADQGNGLVSEVAAGVAGHENNLVKAAVARVDGRENGLVSEAGAGVADRENDLVKEAGAGVTGHEKDLKSRESQGQKVMYGIGSTSKVVVTAAVMKLAEEGLVDLDAPLTIYIPEFEMEDERYVEITPRMLLNHSSGIQGSTLINAMLLGDTDTDNHDHLLERLKTQRLKADPGAFSTYCNDGFTLAEILVERVSGLTYTEFLEKTFAGPLGLSYFKTPQSPMAKEELAPVYDELTGKELPTDMANVIGSGGVYATAEDLCRFSEVFMSERSGTANLLSDASLKDMETSEYGRQMNPDGRDTNLLYGLGWDSVDTYPFSQYGIQALVKGGNTSFYHASLTVLPEENISCAVLSSGGGSSFCQMAAQEILLEYLEEIERIERHEEDPFREMEGSDGARQPGAAGHSGAAGQSWVAGHSGVAEQTGVVSGDVSVPEELLEKSGWYAGWDMFQADVKDDGTLTLASVGTHEGSVQTYRYHDDGRFYGEFGAYINASGDMSRGSNGTVGKTALEFKTGDQGQQYLMAASYEIYPGLGSTAMYLPLAEKISEKPVDEKTNSAWKHAAGTEYYLVSDKYTSAAYMSNFMAKPKVLDAPGGYLVFEKSLLTMAALTDETNAEFFIQVPGQVGRDTSDYQILTRGGKDYLQTSSYRLISEKSLEEFPAENETVTIGNDGETIWFASGKAQAARPVSIEVPENGAFFLYDHSGKEMTCISSSYVLEKGQQILLPKEGRLAFAGDSGASFRIRYH